MAFALKLSFVVILACAVYVQADVSHLGYSRYTGPRVQPLRLQRLESSPTPYPASGYRPNREFNLPNERPLFPLGNQQGNRPFVSSGSDVLSEPIRPQRPSQRLELVYGAPEPRFPQQSRPQSSNAFNGFAAQPQQPEFVEQSNFNNFPENQNNFNSGFNNLAEPQQPQNNQNNFNSGFNNLAEPQQPQNNQNNFNSGFNNLAEPQQPQGNQNNDFNNFAEPQQRPELTYGAPNTQEQTQSGSDELSEPQQPQQRPQYNYNAPSAKLRQLLVARLQQAQRLEQAQRQQQQQADNQAYRYTQGQAQSQAQSQRQQQLTNSPQSLYSAPPQRQQQSQVQSQSQAETSGRLTQKPARLTDNREEREEEDAKTSETVVDIETTTKTETQKSANQVAATTPALAATGLYYPAAAFSYVQPFSAAYVQPVSAAYTVGSTFLPQQYALAAAAAAPAQLQAW